ncbi:transposase [Elysia marginata]|uniref:Transposase n=1 Tax=Elysia marginata TaxID=1093978 RepID=A0AAV4FRZ6_9GAST|nr:transposase [Elysia marginata]
MEFTKENMQFYIFMRCKLGESAKLILEILQTAVGTVPVLIKLFAVGLAGRTFDRIQDLAKAVNSELPEEDYQGVFRKWQIRLKQCMESHGEYFEGL